MIQFAKFCFFFQTDSKPKAVTTTELPDLNRKKIV